MPDYYGRLCSVVSLFSGLHAHQFRPPVRGFVGLVPGFVEVHKPPQRLNGVRVFGAELGLAAWKASRSRGSASP